jgi:hypothetical protein
MPPQIVDGLPLCCPRPGSNPMSPRIDRPRTDNPRLDNLVSWFAASVLVTAGVIYGLKFQDDRRRKPQPEGLPPRATPAQEPLTLQQLATARHRPAGRLGRLIQPDSEQFRTVPRTQGAVAGTLDPSSGDAPRRTRGRRERDRDAPPFAKRPAVGSTGHRFPAKFLGCSGYA